MLTKKLFFILISLVIVFGLAGPAAADAPQTVACGIPWLNRSENGFEYIEFPGEGQLVVNGHGFDLTCHYDIDLNDPDLATMAELCEYYGSWACNAHGNNSLIQNIYYYYSYKGELLELVDTDIMVNANGQAYLHAQYAPDQCSEYKSNNWTLELPPGYWEEGRHTYTMTWELYGSTEEHTYGFAVDENKPLLQNQVRLGWMGPMFDTINPAQDTFMQITSWAASSIVEYLIVDRANSTVMFSWDGGDPVQIQPSPVTNFCFYETPGWLLRTYGYAK